MINEDLFEFNKKLNFSNDKLNFQNNKIEFNEKLTFLNNKIEFNEKLNFQNDELNTKLNFQNNELNFQPDKLHFPNNNLFKKTNIIDQELFNNLQFIEENDLKNEKHLKNDIKNDLKNNIKNNYLDNNIENIIKNNNFINKTALMREYWNFEIKKAENNNLNLKTIQLPLARIKRLMKVEENVKMITQEVPILLALVSEKFIEDLSLRAWLFTKENKRKILQGSDVIKAAKTTSMYDFLIEILPDINDEDKTQIK